MRKMKDSGIEWIGEIPANWNVVKVKYNFINKKTVVGMYADDYERLALTMKGVIKRSKEDADGLQPEKFESYQILKKGELVFKLIDLQNISTSRVGLSPFDGIVSPAYIIINPNGKVISEYAEKFFISMWKNHIFNSMGDTGVRSNLNTKDLLEIRILVPPIDEQIVISKYLDVSMEKINSLVFEIQSQIETLEEYKRSVITEAVTKGLDPNVEMKDSGVQWMGKVPVHWKTVRIGRLFRLRNEKNKLPLDQVQLLSLYTDIGVFPHGEYEERGNKAVTADGYSIVKKNDIVVNIILAWMGAIGVSDYDGVTSPAYDVYVPDLSKVVPHYFHYVFRTSGIAGECYKYGRGIMMMRWRTYSSEFKLINVPYPSLNEQQKIADYLDTKCLEIDDLIAEKKQQIETIEEYKKSLIFEYVTGKKEVPHV